MGGSALTRVSSVAKEALDGALRPQLPTRIEETLEMILGKNVRPSDVTQSLDSAHSLLPVAPDPPLRNVFTSKSHYYRRHCPVRSVWADDGSLSPAAQAVAGRTVRCFHLSLQSLP